jgi:glycosyltransferase involved in cell wall biosynthesis
MKNFTFIYLFLTSLLYNISLTCEYSDKFSQYYEQAQQLENRSTTTEDTWPQTLSLYLKAHNEDPLRVEPFLRIAQHYYKTGEHYLTYLFAYNACQIPIPQDETKFSELYTHTRYDLLGICAWYSGNYDSGEAALKKALEYHPNDQHLKQNLSYYIARKCHEHPKIVGLIPARNEAKIIEQCLHALSLFTDAIVYLDDASDDNSITIVESVADKYNIVKIIKKQIWRRDEPADKNALLKAGREIGGTHFIVIDADEMITANCLKNDFLRNRIKNLKPGDRLLMNWIHLWQQPNFYRSDAGWRYRFKDFIFCDDGICSYDSEFIHTPRTPCNLSGTSYYLDENDYGMLHFQFMNWTNVVIKQSWYKCLEHIRIPEKSVESINQRYAFSMDTTHVEISPVQKIWFDGYDFYSSKYFDTQEEWRTKQMKQWVTQYGINHFKELDFWGLNLENL